MQLDGIETESEFEFDDVVKNDQLANPCFFSSFAIHMKIGVGIAQRSVWYPAIKKVHSTPVCARNDARFISPVSLSENLEVWTPWSQNLRLWTPWSRE